MQRRLGQIPSVPHTRRTVIIELLIRLHSFFVEVFMPRQRFSALTVILVALFVSSCEHPNSPVENVLTPPHALDGMRVVAPKTLDNGGHPNVGALLADFSSDGITVNDLICSGSLISSTVFLTAAHCLQFLPSLGITEVAVSFDSDLSDGVDGVILSSVFEWDPAFGHDAADPHDIGVVVLPAPVGIPPVSLPTASQLSSLAARGGLVGQEFVNVGYGVVPEWKMGPPGFSFDGKRYVSSAFFLGLTKAWLNLNQNVDARGEGGNCFGDSGSPHFLGDTDLAVALTVTGDPNCRALGQHYRLDTPMARTFYSAGPQIGPRYLQLHPGPLLRSPVTAGLLWI